MRSEKYPTHYLVGKCGKNDLYWHHATGIALDIGGLLPYAGGEIDWGPTMALLCDYNQNPWLGDAMPSGLRLAFFSLLEALASRRSEEALDQQAKEIGRVAATELW